MRQRRFGNAIPIGSRPCAVKFMRAKKLLAMTGVFFAHFGWAQSAAPNDPIKTLAGRLDLAQELADV